MPRPSYAYSVDIPGSRYGEDGFAKADLGLYAGAGPLKDCGRGDCD
ncbi:hypothetical protein [Streptomyces sp. AP-93]|nr:hypothetical protein [Streptomyces sp. AP-93]MCJ0868694.1 hypothetical protein [Streptomyces sp. AP-93]